MTATVRLEEALRYDPQARKPDERWYWQALFAPAKAEISFDAPGVEAGPAELQVYLVAKSSAPVDPDHRVLVSLNGKLVADAPWDGMVPHLVTASIPPGLLKPTGNQLVVQATADAGAPADIVPASAGRRIAYQRTPGDNARRSHTRVDGGDNQQRAARLAWRYDLVDFVTTPPFHDALDPLVDTKAKQGLRMAVLDWSRSTTSFSYDHVDPSTIQAFIRRVHEHWQAPALRFLLLTDDASSTTLLGPQADTKVRILHSPGARRAQPILGLDRVRRLVCAPRQRRDDHPRL